MPSVGNGSAGSDNELRNYSADLESLTEDTDAVQYWVSKESQYKCIAGLALDVVAAPASQAYVERLFSVCGVMRHENATKQRKVWKREFSSNSTAQCWLNCQRVQ